MAEVVAQGGGRANIRYLAVLNSMYRRVAMVAAGASTAAEGNPYWHGNLTVEAASDARIGNVYVSLAGVWFIEGGWARILDFLCLIIDIRRGFFDRPRLPETSEARRASSGEVPGPPLSWRTPRLLRGTACSRWTIR